MIRRSLRRCTRGATIVEFALVAPVLMLVLMGLLDQAQRLYMIGALQGVVQKAARDSTLEDQTDPAKEAALDQRVIDQVKALVPDATVPTPTRDYYSTYAGASQKVAEVWSDTDHDGTCDHGEQFTDINGNGTWDVDGGANGAGGAKDRVIYTVNVSYARLFPMARLIGMSNTVALTATTVLQNQPYAEQVTYTPTTGTCS